MYQYDIKVWIKLNWKVNNYQSSWFCLQIKTALSEWSIDVEAESANLPDVSIHTVNDISSSSSDVSLRRRSYESVTSNESTSADETISNDVEPARKRNRAIFNLCDMFGDSSHQTQQSSSRNELICSEITNYDAIRINIDCESHLDFDILKWWQMNQAQFPTMARFARFIHAIPATSAPSERCFSAAGNVYSEKRTSMKPETLNSILLLRSNWDLADFKFGWCDLKMK